MTPGVSVSIENPPHVDKGDLFNLKVRLKAERSGSYNIDLKLPEGFEGRERTSREVVVEEGQEMEYDLDVDATGYLGDEEYDLGVKVRDNRGLTASENRSIIKVDEPMIIRTPLLVVKVPSINRIKDNLKGAQEKLFSIVNTTTHIIYASTWAWVFLILMLLFTAYLYSMWKRGRS